jgi:hypothetical protein
LPELILKKTFQHTDILLTMFDKLADFGDTKLGKALLYAMVIVIFVLVIILVGPTIYTASKAKLSSEHFDSSASINGSGLFWRNTAALTSGSSQRNAGEFSQPNQGDRTSLYNADVNATAALLGLSTPMEIKAGQYAIQDIRAADKSSVNPNLPATQTTGIVPAVASMPVAAGASVAAIQGASQAAANAAAEYLVSDRYGPEFLESSSRELAAYQAQVPPTAYQVLDGATKSFASGVEYMDSGDFRRIGLDPY